MHDKIFRGYNRIKFPSQKLGKTVFCQSLLLRDYLIHLEWDENIKFYQTKPFKISYRQDNHRKVFHPHLLVENLDKQQTVVWITSSITDEDTHFKFVRLMSNICQTNNYLFMAKQPEEIRKEPFFSNLKILRRYNRTDISINQVLLCDNFFTDYTSLTFGNLTEFLLGKNQKAEVAYALLYQRIIEADLHSDFLDDDTPIMLRKRLPAFQNGRIAA